MYILFFRNTSSLFVTSLDPIKIEKFPTRLRSLTLATVSQNVQSAAQLGHTTTSVSLVELRLYL